MKEKKQKISIAYCGGMIMMFALIAYVINFSMPTSSSYAYIGIVGPIFPLIGVVILVIGLIIKAAKKKQQA